MHKLTLHCHATTDDTECMGPTPPDTQGADDVLMERLKKRKAPAEPSAEDEAGQKTRKEQKVTDAPAV